MRNPNFLCIAKKRYGGTQWVSVVYIVRIEVSEGPSYLRVNCKAYSQDKFNIIELFKIF